MKNLQDIAAEFGVTVWNNSRVYTDHGYTTKKMKSTTYYYIVDGEICASAFVQCANQPMSWCIAEAAKLKEMMLQDLD